MGGYIMQLQNFSVNDGEGIRTNIFLAGCPLRCAWCANPEGQTCENALTHFAEAEEILQVIRRQEIFYRHSGGGVTFSGGEPTLQPEFLKELTDILYDEGYSLAIETCGQFVFEEVNEILRKMDLIFMDFKHVDTDMHRKYTSVGNEEILENICRTSQLNIPMVVRIPVIVGVNGDNRTLEAMFAFLRDCAPKASLELLPYHRYGEDKYRKLGMEFPPAGFIVPSAERMDEWKRLAEEMGLQVVCYQ